MQNLEIKIPLSGASGNINKCYGYYLLRCTSLIIFCFIFLFSCKKSVEYSDSLQEKSAETQVGMKGQNANIGINILLNTAITPAIIAELKIYGQVGKIFNEINALTMVIESDKITLIQSLSFVRLADADTEAALPPVNAAAVNDYSDGISTWNLDAINVTELGIGRTVTEDGTGVYVGVLDTGLPYTWREYLPEERIAVQYAKSFGGGGGELGNTPEQPNKWEHDQNSHGIHVTSTIIGFRKGATIINGVAPKATIIPVKVLNQNGSGWFSTVAQGILYMAELKSTVLQNHPVIINMSLGGPQSAILIAAMDYAISKGVIIVAAAGNSGELGMGYPGAYGPVIGVAAVNWVAQFTTPTWWYNLDVPDPSNVNNFRVASFSSRKLLGQDLDVAAPGEAIVGPYQINGGHLSYYFLSGTSMASPHVAGIVALMAQRKPTLTAAEAEMKLESSAVAMAEGANAAGSGFITATAALAGL